MTRDQLLAAKPGVLALIREQSEKRLENQCAFASAQDARSGAIMNSSAALAAAAVAVAAGSMTASGLAAPLTVGASLAVAGFSFATGLAIWTKRSQRFHSVGWFPEDFEKDLAAKATKELLEADLIIALQSRLTENEAALDERGDLSNRATWALLATPLIAFAGALAAIFAGTFVAAVGVA